MKKRSAPSILFQVQKERKTDEEEEDVPVKKAKGKKEETKVNHLMQWSLKPVEDAKEEHVEEEESEEGDPTRPGKNAVMTESSRPMFWAVNIRLANSTRIDGLIKVTFADLTLFDESGKQIGFTVITREEGDEGEHLVKIKRKYIYLQERYSLPIGNKNVTIIGPVSEEEFKTGTFFMQDFKQRLKEKEKEAKPKPVCLFAAARRPPTGKFITPFKGTKNPAERRLAKPLHSPNAPGALILFNPKDIFSENKIAVVVDPILTATLRPHQREGIQFLFDTVCMGVYDPITKKKYNGCILADEMGLGKSIQAISLIWTALKQGPTGEPTARKAVIVCPSSLVGNWCKEIAKWLGDRLKPMGMGESSKRSLGKLSQFQFGEYDVLVISYDQMKIYAKDLEKVHNIDMVICDEGHRLKNAQIKTSQAVKKMSTVRRVILSGTPIQNDLMELYAMVDYVNPGILGTEKQFKKLFEEPILASREKEASDEEKEIGRARSAELTLKTEKFILRRTAVTNAKYLPPKIDYLIFCGLTQVQKDMYNKLCKVYSEKIGERIEALPLLTTLKKLCNTPELLHIMMTKKEDRESPVADLFPPAYNDGEFSTEYAGKLLFTDKLLNNIRTKKKGDKIVIVSNYTETLAVLARLCKLRGYGYFQLDGSTAVNKRQKLVDDFNQVSAPQFVFLLSSKAGGCGLNLVGANHLMLFDPDWNPANDEQAMARVWRPGQQKKVFLYRTLCTGTLEEKVYQRQVTKLALSKSVVKGSLDGDYVQEDPSFTAAELRDIFRYREETISDTHDLLNCRCSSGALKIPPHKRKILTDAATGICSFVMYKETDTAAALLVQDTKEETPEISENGEDSGDSSNGPEEKEVPAQISGEISEEESGSSPSPPPKRRNLAGNAKKKGGNRRGPPVEAYDSGSGLDDGGPDAESEDEDFSE
ncbi:hypothetical protein PROFUN_03379 [Planoprotostelium fungivorum]|uniref:DNA repair and recombination protein RAD54 n=1 Tax=Planoprotostelium fungivorum TaxID=1890364 RepID=A0A2P6NWD5_9EUKA|nr:hypothetical protein PROFUN_03379 [Planoprotostelium fungivorum]